MKQDIKSAGWHFVIYLTIFLGIDLGVYLKIWGLFCLIPSSLLLSVLVGQWTQQNRRIAQFKRTVTELTKQKVDISVQGRMTFDGYLNSRQVKHTADKVFEETMKAVDRLTKTIL